ncbi:MAG: TonB-dependent receptor [Gemmatimonadota bacterium]
MVWSRWRWSLLAVACATAAVAEDRCTLDGSVVEAGTGLPLAGAVVRLEGVPIGTTSDESGRFVLRGAPAGRVAVTASLIGYRPGRRPVSCAAGDTVRGLIFELNPAPLQLDEVVVTPGRFAIMQQDPVVPQTLTGEDIRTIPQFGEDVYRAVRRLPGVGGGDISARFTVRGGEYEEVLVRLDGQELFEPFHLKDFSGGALSIVDVMAIGGIDMMTGGFPARFGNHLSGVFDVATVTPSQRPRTAVGISLMNTRFFTEGHFGDGRGNWLVSARRGYLDIVLSLVNPGSGISPVYYDLLGKVEYRLSDRQLLSAHVLYAQDDLSAADDDGGDNLSSSYGNHYLWLRLRSSYGDRLASETVLSGGAVTRQRQDEDFEDVWSATGQYILGSRLEFDLHERRRFDLLGLRQDWTWEASPRLLAAGGYDLKLLDSEYDYRNRNLVGVENGDPLSPVFATTAVDTAPGGSAVSLYGSLRWRALEPLVLEAGLRHDRLSYTGDRVLDPRLNGVLSLGPRTSLRAGWGWFHQGQAIDDLDVPYGELVYYPAQRAEHRVLGLEHAFGNGVDLRLEVYQKRLTSIRPRHENLSRDVLFAPELEEVSVFLAPQSGQARGFEVYLKRDAGGRFSWWGSYALAGAEETIDGRVVPKNQDQRHTVYFDGSWRPSSAWRVAAAWQYRSGWPFTARRFVRVDVPEGEWPFRDGFGPRNAVRLPAYHRLDLRVNRYFEVRGGRLSLFVEVSNLYDRQNVRDIRPGNRRQVVNGQLVALTEVRDEWLPLLPSVGASWEF